jgi:hypothetical protein
MNDMRRYLERSLLFFLILINKRIIQGGLTMKIFDIKHTISKNGKNKTSNSVFESSNIVEVIDHLLRHYKNKSLGSWFNNSMTFGEIVILDDDLNDEIVIQIKYKKEK